MAIRYNKFAIWQISMKNFKNRKIKIDEQLRSMGIRRKVPLTRIIHIASMKPISLDEEDIKRISRRKKFEI